MKTLFTLTAGLLLTAGAFAQAYSKPRAIVFDPNSCNNVAVVEIYNNTPHGWVWHSPSQWWLGTQEVVEDGDTVDNICFNDATLGTDGFDFFSSNGYISHSLLYSTIITPNYNYTVESYVAPTDENSEDGSFILDFDSSVVAYDYFIEQDAAYLPTVTFINDSTVSISDLNEGFITIHFDDPMDPYNYAHFRIYAGDPSELYVNDGLDINVSYHNANGNCEGWISLQPTNATPGGTIYYNWPDDVNTENFKACTRSNLCPGTYTVYVSEMVNGYYTKAYIDTFVIADNNATVIDPGLYSIEQDWIAHYSESMYCWIYDWETLDSSKTFADTLYFDDNLLIATYDTIRYLGNETLTSHDSIISVTDSIIVYDRTTYCEGDPFEFLVTEPHDQSAENNGQTYTDFLITGESEEIAKATIYPNPTQGDLTIDFNNYGTYKLLIFDSAGRLIETQYVVDNNRQIIDTDAMQPGTYMLFIHSSTGVETHRFVKSDY